MGPETRTDQMFLATLPPGPIERRLAYGVVLVSLIFFVVAVPFAQVPLTPVWAFIPIYESALALNDLVTASLLFAKFSILRSRALLVLACGYLFTAFMVVPHALTFPGLFSTDGLLGAGPQSTVWLYIFWHGGFPLFVIAYTFLKALDDRAPSLQTFGGSIATWSIVAATCALCVLLTALATTGHNFLPDLIRDKAYTPTMLWVSALMWALSPVSLLILWRRWQHHSVIDLWLAVVMCAWTFDVGLSTVFNATRFDLGFYAGRAFGLLAATCVLLVLLIGTAGLYARIVGLLALEKRARERALEALRDSIARLNAIFSSASISIMMLNESGSIESLNPATERLFGLTSDAMLRRDVGRFLDLGGSNDINSAARLSDLVANGATLCPLVGHHCDGSSFPVEAVLTEMIVSDRRLFAVFVHDGRSKKLAEEKFRLAVDACPSGMVMIDANDQIILVNAETERLFERSHQELIGLAIEELVPHRLRTGVNQIPKAFRKPLKDQNLFGLRKDQTEFPIEVSLNPIQTNEGLITLCVIIDISERQRNDRIKNEFVATVSHELRTPLTSIAASLSLLDASTTAGQFPEATKRLLKIASNNSQRLVRLINDILDIEKIESGKVEFDMQRIDVLPLLQQAIENNRGFADQFGVTVRLDSDSNDASVYVDPDRLMQVITNLLSNAAKFSYVNGEVVVSVIPDSDSVQISIRDYGPGMSEKFKPHVFEKFAQADATDRRQKGGTGLGLSIAKQIMQRFHGDLRFEDARGGGTVFHVSLPKFQTAIDMDLNKTILLCDDDPDAAAALVPQLHLAGFTTHVTHSAEEAIWNATQRHYAAILVDLKLPDQDGISLIKQLRLQWHCLNIPIVVVSANPQAGQSDKRASALNILDWLAKPVDVERLTRVLSRPIIRNANPRPRILHVDDDRDILQLVSTILSPNAEVVSVDSVESARYALARNAFDLAVIDIALEKGIGPDLLPDLRDRKGYPIPVIVFSGQNTSEISAQVCAALTKSRSSIDTLATMLRHIVANQQPKRAPLIEEVA